MKKGKREKAPSVEMEDTRPWRERMMEGVMTILTEPVLGLTELARKYGCTYSTYVPSEEAETTRALVWEPRYEDGEGRYYEDDIRWEDKPCEYYLVEDAAKREICIVKIVPGNQLSSDHYLGEVRYVGPPEEKKKWEKLMEEIRQLRID